jgi:hypothetical protein
VSPLAAPQRQETQGQKLNADSADHADGFKSFAGTNLNRRWPKTNIGGDCERSVIPLSFTKFLPSAICVHPHNPRPKLLQQLRVSLPLWQPIPDEHSSDFSTNLPDV